MKPLLKLSAADIRALEASRRLPPPPLTAILKMSRQLAPVVWDAVRRRPLPAGGFALPRLALDAFPAYYDALEKRQLASLTFAEVRKGVQALSSVYVERRARLAKGAALQGSGKRAGFALYYGSLHLLCVREIARSLGATVIDPASLVDLGCGTLSAGAGWALAAREAGRAVELLGVESNAWAAGEARFTLDALRLRGRVSREDACRFRMPARTGAVVAAFTVNELDDAGREGLLPQLLDAAARGTQVLIVEPLAKRNLGWWSSWEKAFRDRGGRADEWRFTLPLPERLRLLDKAAGLDHRQLGARSLYLALAS